METTQVHEGNSNGSGSVGARREKFVSLAEARVSRAMHTIRLVGNLANKSNYEYNDEDIRKILNALQAELVDLKQRFNSQSSRSRPLFKL
jgi:hypothetical protein